MIDSFGLFLISLEDIKKREISILSMAGIFILFLYPALRGSKLYVSGMFVGMILVGVSLITKQALGLGDSLIMMLLGLKLGDFELLLLIFHASLYLGIFSGFLTIFLKKKIENLPFLPFLSFAYFYLGFGGEKL